MTKKCSKNRWWRWRGVLCEALALAVWLLSAGVLVVLLDMVTAQTVGGGR